MIFSGRILRCKGCRWQTTHQARVIILGHFDSLGIGPLHRQRLSLFIHTMHIIGTCLSSTTPPIDIHENYFIGSERHLVNESTKHCLTKWQLVCVHNFQCINTYGCRVHCLLSLYGSHTRALNSLASVAASPNTTQ